MKKLITICLVCVCLLSTISTVLADDIYPPSWRGQNGTVVAYWDSSWTYGNDGWGAYGSGLSTGLPWVTSGEGSTVLDEFEGRIGVIQLTGDNQLEFEMPNFINENPVKLMQIQVTYFPPNENQYSFPFVYKDNPGDLMVYTTGRDTHYLESGWQIDVWDLEIHPNPDYETIRLNFYDMINGYPSYPVYIDQVVIDTWCVPEPTTICMLSFGALSLIRRKK